MTHSSLESQWQVSLRFLYVLAQLLRVPVSLLAGIMGLFTTYTLNSTLPWHQYFLIAVLLCSMTAAACAINDYWDVEKDRINHPQRPLPSGQLSLALARWIAVGLFGVALVAASWLGIYPLLLTVCSTVLLWHYSHFLQTSGILGNLLVAAIIALVMVLGSLVAQRPFANLYLTGFLFSYALAREVVWDVHDAAGDRAQGVVTIANHWGADQAFAIVWGLLALLAVSMPIALLFLPMAHPLVFTGFCSIMLLSFGLPLGLYQYQGSETAYERLVFWERLGMLAGVIGLLGTAP